MWWIYTLLPAFLAVLTASFAKVEMKNIDTDLATAVRAFSVLLLVWAMALMRGRTDATAPLTRQNVIVLFLSGIATGLSWLCYVKALQLRRTFPVAPVDRLSLVLTILFSVVFLGETLTMQKTIGAICIVVGTLIIIQ
ncbi:EamA family transporter [Chryseolinea soli]|uniref:EamA family transporter n=1 Tax=Chryseolinea soli TaxID=2321403 RepID=A0A385SWC6_9BACT|nr:EamA family transporter [Chryseolinea soli]AYB34591.1 EamA family transporter [Chryseolinea soli]